MKNGGNRIFYSFILSGFLVLFTTTSLFGLNQIANSNFTANSTSWVVDNQVSAADGGMTAYTWIATDGSPLGSYYGHLNNVSFGANWDTDLLIQQTFTSPASTCRAIFSLDHKDVWGTTFDSYTLIGTLRSGGTYPNETVRSTFFNDATCSHNTWQTSGWTAPFTLTVSTSYIVRVWWTTRCDNGRSAGSMVDNVYCVLSPTGLRATPSGSTVVLTWNASTGGTGVTLDHYNVYRSSFTSDPDPVQIATVTAGTTYTDTALPSDEVLYYTIKDVDTTGIVSPFSTEAMAVKGFAVSDGLLQDIVYSWLTDRVEANWTHPKAPIVKYLVAVGTTPLGTNVVDWTDVGMNNKASLTGLSLASGSTYYTTVRALDCNDTTQAIECSDGFTVRCDPVYTDAASQTYFNNGRVAELIDFSDPEKIKPKELSGTGGAGYWQYRVKVTVTEPGITDRVNAPCRVQFAIPVGQRPTAVTEFRVSDENGNELRRYNLSGSTVANPDISFLVNMQQNDVRDYWVYWGNAAVSDPNYGFILGASQTSTIEWTPYYTRKLLPIGLETVPLALNYGWVTNVQMENTANYSGAFRDDARSDQINPLFAGNNFYFYGNICNAWNVWTNGLLYQTNTTYTSCGGNLAQWRGSSRFTGGIISPFWVDLQYKNNAYPANSGIFRDNMTSPTRIVFTWRCNVWVDGVIEDDIYIFQTVVYLTGDIAHRYEYISPRGTLGIGGYQYTSNPCPNMHNTAGLSANAAAQTTFLYNTPVNIGTGLTPTSLYQNMDAFRGFYTVSPVMGGVATYVDTAHFESMVFDSRSSTPSWATMTYQCTGGAGRLCFSIRSGDTQLPELGGWCNWVSVATATTNGNVAVPAAVTGHRYIQYQCNLQRNSNGALPELDQVQFSCRGISIESITANTPLGVCQGQDGILVRATIRNDNTTAVNITGASLTFSLGSYTVSLLSPSLPVPLAGGVATYATFSVSVLDNSPVGTATINAVATATAGALTFSDNDAQYPHTWWVRRKAALVINEVRTIPTTVNQGQNVFPVSLLIENTGETPFSFIGASLTFGLGTYTIGLPSPGIGTIVDGPGSRTFDFSVTVSPVSDCGAAVINGTASGTNTFSLKPVGDASATITDSWMIQRPSHLIFDTVLASATVFRGQINTPVYLTVSNEGGAVARWDSSDLLPHFVNGTYDAAYPNQTFPIEVSGGGIATTARYGVDIAPSTATGPDTVDATIAYTDGNTGIPQPSVVGALFPATWTILAESVKTYKDPGFVSPWDSFNRPLTGTRIVYAKAEDLAYLQEFSFRWFNPSGVEVASTNPPLTSDASGTLPHQYTLTPTSPYGVWTIKVTNPINTFTFCQTSFEVVSPASLTVFLTLPTSVSVGQPFNATMTFNNAGGATISGGYPSKLTTAGTGVATLTGGPFPANQSISGYSQATFTWNFAAVSPGSFIATGCGFGFDANSLDSLQSASSTASCMIQNPPKVTIASISVPGRLVYLNQTGIIVNMGVRNAGSAAVVITDASLSIIIGNYTQSVASPPLPFTLLGNNTIATFNFAVGVEPDSPTGQATLTGRLLFYDKNYPASETWIASPTPIATWTIATIGILLSDQISMTPEQYAFNRGQTVRARAYGFPSSPTTPPYYRMRFYPWQIPLTGNAPTGAYFISPPLVPNASGQIDFYCDLPTNAAIATWSVDVDVDNDMVVNPPEAMFSVNYFLVLKAGNLVASLTLTPASCYVGDTITATLVASNTIGSSSTISPATASDLIKTTGSYGDVTYIGGPNPASATIWPLSCANFVWTFTAASHTGLLANASFSMTAQLANSAYGVDVNTNTATCSLRAVSNGIKIYQASLTCSPDIWNEGTLGPGESGAPILGSVFNSGNVNLAAVKWEKVDLNGPGGQKIPETYLNFYASPLASISAAYTKSASSTLTVPDCQATGTYVGSMTVYEDGNGNDRRDSGEPYDIFSVRVVVPAKKKLRVVENLIDLGDWPPGATSNVENINILNVGNLDLANLKFAKDVGSASFISITPVGPSGLLVDANMVGSVSATIPALTPTGIYISTWVAWEDEFAPFNATGALEASDTFQIRIGVGAASFTLSTPTVNAGTGTPTYIISGLKEGIRNTGSLPLTHLIGELHPLDDGFGNSIASMGNIGIFLPAQIPLASAATASLELYIPAGTAVGTFTGIQYIIEDTNDNGKWDVGEASQSFILKVLIPAFKALQVIPLTVDLGDFSPGTGRTVSFLCRNSGNVTLTPLRWQRVDLFDATKKISLNDYYFPPVEPFSATAGAIFSHDITINIVATQTPGNYVGSSSWLFEGATRTPFVPQDSFLLAARVGTPSLKIDFANTSTGNPSANSSLVPFQVTNDGSLTLYTLKATATSLIGPQTIPATCCIFFNPIGNLPAGNFVNSNWQVAVPANVPAGNYFGTLSVWADSDNQNDRDQYEASNTATLQLTINSAKSVTVVQDPLNLGTTPQGTTATGVVEIINTGNIALTDVRFIASDIRTLGGANTIAAGNISMTPSIFGAMGIGVATYATLTVTVGSPQADGFYFGNQRVYDECIAPIGWNATEVYDFFELQLTIAKKEVLVNNDIASIDFGFKDPGATYTQTFTVNNTTSIALTKLKWKISAMTDGVNVIPAANVAFLPVTPPVFGVGGLGTYNCTAQIYLGSVVPPGTYIGTHTVWEDDVLDDVIQSNEASDTFNTVIRVNTYKRIDILPTLVDFGKIARNAASPYYDVGFRNMGNASITGFLWTFSNLTSGANTIPVASITYSMTFLPDPVGPGAYATSQVRIGPIGNTQAVGVYNGTPQTLSGTGAISDSTNFRCEIIPGGPQVSSGTIWQELATDSFASASPNNRFILSAWVCPGTGTVGLGFFTVDVAGNQKSFQGVEVSSTSSVVGFGGPVEVGVVESAATRNSKYSQPFVWYRVYVAMDYQFNQIVASKTYLMLINDSPKIGSHSVWIDGVQLEKATFPNQTRPTAYNRDRKILSPNQSQDLEGIKKYSEW